MSLKRIRPYIIILIFYCLPSLVYAQQTFTLNGILYRKNTTDRISQAVITDLKSNVIMMSDELGNFNIIAAKGDTLLFNKSGYVQEKQVVTDPKDVIVYLQPIISLGEVNIKEQSKQQELNDVMAQYRSNGTFYDGKPPAWLLLNSPITVLYELFGKTPNEARRFKAFSKEELEQDEVNRRYTPALVKQVTKLTNDEDVKKFMEAYTPSYEDIKAWNDYDLINHIKKSFDFYQKNKNPYKLPKLY
jgi:hypothetical protein